MKAKILKMRFSKKVMLILSGVLLLGGASGAFALYVAHKPVDAEAAAEASLSGEACTTIQTLKLRRNGQRWIRKYVETESIGGIERVRTALRVAGVLAKQEKADFYQVVILDHAGPKDRARFRGAAIGAEVLFAPQPEQIPGMTAPFVAKYNEADANMAGLFHGKEVVMPLEAIKATLTEMDDKSDCAEVIVEIGEPGSEAGHKSMPGDEEVATGHEPAGEHGGASESGHGEKPSEEAHGEAAGEDTHGEASAEGAHGEPAAETETGGGMFASIKGMIFGADEPAAEAHGESPAGHDTAPAGTGDHAAAPAGTEEHAAAPAGADEHAAAKPEENGGMFASIKGMIFGADEPATGADGESSAAHDTAAPAGTEEHATSPAGTGEHSAAPAGADEHATTTAETGEHAATPAEGGDHAKTEGHEPAAHAEDAAAPAKAEHHAAAEEATAH